jgi:Kef-type K+ transport system membrane component KefB
MSHQLILIAIVLFLIIVSTIVSKLKYTAVVTHIIIGVIVAVLAHYNLWIFRDLIHNDTISLMAQFGGILLLLEVGLKFNFAASIKHHRKIMGVAIIGITLPLLIGAFIMTPLIITHIDITHTIFFGALLAITSTGVSVAIFNQLNFINKSAAQIVISSSIIDDIMGLVLLSVILELIYYHHISSLHVFTLSAKIIITISITVITAIIIFPYIYNKILVKLALDNSLITTSIITITLFISTIMQHIGLSALLGALISGVGIRNSNKIKEVANYQQQISVIGSVFIPIFFMAIGMQLDIVSAFSISTFKLCLVLTLFAIFSKIFCGILLPTIQQKILVGVSMIPRGELGLVFVFEGLRYNLINNDMATAIVLMVILTSLIATIVLNLLIVKLE